MNKSNKLLLLSRFEMKRRLQQSGTLLTVLLIFSVLSVFFMLLQQASKKPLQTVALVIEDPSFEIKAFVSNISDNRLKGIFTFEEMDFDTALLALSEKRVFAVLHIKEEIFKKLNRFEEESLDLYLADSSSPVSRFFVRYTENLTAVLNEAQSSARVYLRQMRASRVPEEEIWDRLTDIQIDYISAFLTRSSVFDASLLQDNYFGLDILSYYFFSALLLLAMFTASALLHPLRDDLQSGRWERLSFCGYPAPLRITAHLLSCTLPLFFLLLIMRTGYALLTDPSFSIKSLLPLLPKLILIAGTLSLLLLTLIRGLSPKNFSDRIYAAFLILLALISGFFIPLPALGKSFRLMERINPLTISHKLLFGADMSLSALLVFGLCSSLCIFLLVIWERR